MTAGMIVITATIIIIIIIIIVIADAADAAYAVFSDVCAAESADIDTANVVQSTLANGLEAEADKYYLVMRGRILIRPYIFP